jgi:VCBS repeat protein
LIHAKRDGVVRNLGAVVISLLAALCLCADVAQASIMADFNGDGVLDAVVLPRPPETNLVIRVSGLTPQILKLSGRSGRLISIVAADIDHDGHLDLSALSERRGLLVWLNKAGHGRFAPLKKHRAPRSFAFLGRVRTSATQPGDNTPASGDQGGVSDSDAPRAGPVFDAPSGGYTVPIIFSASSEDLGKSAAPRGPPS